MVFCSGTCLAPYAGFYFQHIARTVERDRSIKTVFVHPSDQCLLSA